MGYDLTGATIMPGMPMTLEDREKVYRRLAVGICAVVVGPGTSITTAGNSPFS